LSIAVYVPESVEKPGMATMLEFAQDILAENVHKNALPSVVI
jgi:hypothetical protein